MTKYVANPVVVDAWRITYIPLCAIGVKDEDYWDTMAIRLENNEVINLSKEMTARMMPVVGDYLVRSADGYEYLNPKDVFQAKYTMVNEE